MTTFNKRIEELRKNAQFKYSKDYQIDMHPTYHFTEGFIAGANAGRELIGHELLKSNMAYADQKEKLDVAINWIEKETDCQRLSFRHVRPCSRCDILDKLKGLRDE